MSQPKTAGRLARAVDLLQSKALGLQPVRTRYTVDRGLRVPTRDGAVLVSDHYAPTGVALGTVLIRTPYGRGLPVSFVRICDVDTRGRSWNVSETFRKLDGPGKLVAETSPCAHRFLAGHRIRLQISGGAYPRFDRNPNSVDYLIDCGDSSLHLPTGIL